MDKKKRQLGVNPSTASGRLVKDILFDLVVKTSQDSCHRCGGQLTRETFSIEHKIPWLDSDNPTELYFDLDNISFSHRSCNASAARRTKSVCGTLSKYTAGCRCSECKEACRQNSKDKYNKETRRAQYLRTGN